MGVSACLLWIWQKGFSEASSTGSHRLLHKVPPRCVFCPHSPPRAYRGRRRQRFTRGPAVLCARGTDFTLLKESQHIPRETRPRCGTSQTAPRCLSVRGNPPEPRSGVAALPDRRARGPAAPGGLAEPVAQPGARAARPHAGVHTKLGIIHSPADPPATPRVIKVNGTRISSASICTGALP